MSVRVHVCALSKGAACILSAVDPAFFPVTGSGQISAHLENNSPEENLFSQHVALFLFLPSCYFSLSLPYSASDSSVSDPDRDPPELLYSALPLPLYLFFFGFRSLTLSVSFYIMLSVKIPCGRAVTNTSAHTDCTHIALTLKCTCAHTRMDTYIHHLQDYPPL